MTFNEWFYSEPYRKKYTDDHPVYLAAKEAWQAAHEECAKVCEENAKAWLVGNNDWCLGQVTGSNDCADAIRARGEKQ